MPEFQNDPEHDAWKKGVMSGAIQLEEIDTEAFKDRYGKLAVNVAPTQKVAAGIAVAPDPSAGTSARAQRGAVIW